MKSCQSGNLGTAVSLSISSTAYSANWSKAVGVARIAQVETLAMTGIDLEREEVSQER